MKNTITYTEHYVTVDLECNPLAGRMAGKSFINMLRMFKSVPYEVKVLRTKIKKGCSKGKTRKTISIKPKTLLTT